MSVASAIATGPGPATTSWTCVFWRYGKLLAADADIVGHELFSMNDSRAVVSRALLLNDGNVAVSLDNYKARAHVRCVTVRFTRWASA
ncbi:hypothetical protein ACWCQL_20650 [Streptomyces sp. NPDC002073]